MSTYNKTILCGYACKDAEDVKGIAKFSLATHKKYKDKAGVMQEITNYHNVVFFGKAAENVIKYVKKGDLIIVDGEISYRKYSGKDGVEKLHTSIECQNFQIVKSKSAKSTVDSHPDFDDEIPF